MEGPGNIFALERDLDHGVCSGRQERGSWQVSGWRNPGNRRKTASRDRNADVSHGENYLNTQDPHSSRYDANPLSKTEFTWKTRFVFQKNTKNKFLEWGVLGNTGSSRGKLSEFLMSPKQPSTGNF